MRRNFLITIPYSVMTGVVAATGCSTPLSPATQEVAHRPWALPRTPWVLGMRWSDLLFLHWAVRPALMRPLIPNALELDVFDGWCWIGVVPFQMSDVRPRYLPFAFAFPELNVRTYVKGPKGPGVWFFSLDAASGLAVRAARWLGMPYYDAQMTLAADGEYVRATSKRVHKAAPSADFDALYKPTGPNYYATPGSLDHWLTERYCLYAALNPDKVVYGEIHHAQWRLQPAEVDLKLNTMIKQVGLTLPEGPPLCHFSRLQQVVAWPIVPLQQK